MYSFNHKERIKNKECTVGFDPKNSELLAKIKVFFSQSGTEAFLVGGYLRDCLLKRPPEDIDLAIADDILTAAPALAEFIGGHYVLLDEENHIARITLPAELQSENSVSHIDINTIQKDIYHDLSRRDFTINAMALPIDKINEYSEKNCIQALFDPFGGLAAIPPRILTAVSPQVFRSDGLRLLRGVRLSRELGFEIDTGTLSAMKQNSDSIQNIAGERVREEFLRLFRINNTGDAIAQLDELGIISGIIPELALCKKTEQPKEHYWDVFGHSIKCIDACDYVLRKGEWPYAPSDIRELVPWSSRLRDYFDSPVTADSNRRQILKIAALFHDIAKPQTRTITEDGRIRFYEHPAKGEPITRSIMIRLRFSSREARMVSAMTLHHLRPVQMNQKGELPTDRAIYRYLRDAGDIAIDTLFLSLADHLSARGPTLEPGFWAEHCRITGMVISKKEEAERNNKAPSLINGYDLLDNFNVVPGPIF
ncbi:MAG: HD domain-containing protein, partial [Dehalococcoidales bacterium]|nr:HD domain-containing protein [Dehalococcoidales bacterium]